MKILDSMYVFLGRGPTIHLLNPSGLKDNQRMEKGPSQKIEILGGGCEACRKLAADVQSVVREAQLDAEVIKVTDLQRILDYGVITTPAMVLNGRVVSAGRTLSIDEIHALLGLAPRCSPPAHADRDVRERLRTGVRTLLLLFVLASIGIMLGREMFNGIAVATDDPLERDPSVTVVYYFHGAQRCWTCNRIEHVTWTTITNRFQTEYQAGRLIWRTRDLEDPRNFHYLSDFNLDSRGVVIKKGKHVQKLPEVWVLAGGDTARFSDFIEKQINAVARSKDIPKTEPR